MSVHQMNQQLTGDGIISEEPCSRFTLFPFLPTEIRLRIWRFHNYRPRIIMCKCYFWSNKHGDDQTCFRLPASFLVNSESREEAKKAFSLVFESLLTYDIAFNNVADTLYFEHQWIEYTFPSKDFSKAGFHAGTLVKSLALHLDLCNYRDLAGVLQVEEFAFVLDIHGVCKALKGFPNVQELFLITESKSQSVLDGIRRLVDRIYYRLRRYRAECCEKHDPECDCAVWRFPKIHWNNFDELKETVGAEEVVKY